MKESNIVLYETEDGKVNIDVILKDETIWLTQKNMAILFGVRENNITYHLQNIFDSNELDKNSVTQKIRVTASDGKKYLTGFYNLDAIIAVGYRVNSKKATKFLIWATDVLKEYLTKGFALNDERFIRGNKYDAKYFDELLERIKTIRVSERMSYQKIN